MRGGRGKENRLGRGKVAPADAGGDVVMEDVAKGQDPGVLDKARGRPWAGCAVCVALCLTPHSLFAPFQMRSGAAPLEVSTRVMCRWRDGDFQAARVVERRKVEVAARPQKAGAAAGPSGEWEYYVHYENCNRRMDSWVTAAMMDLGSVEYDQAAAERDAAGASRTRQQRRRDEPPPAHGGNVHAEEEHPEFDPHRLREHEEFTKVRNILSIELGRHEMDTWYFSPFPPEFKDCSKLFFCEVRAWAGSLGGGWMWPDTHPPVASVHAGLLQAQGAAAAPPAQERAAAPAGGRDLPAQRDQHV